MLRLFLLFFLIPACLRAHDSLQFAVGMGYRRDDAGMKFSEGLTELYTEKDLLNGIELDLFLRVPIQKVLLTFEGDVGWFVSGSGRNNPTLQPPSMNAYEGRFNQSAGGYFTDGMVNLGYAFGAESLQLVPQAGYGVFYQQIKHGSNNPQFDRTVGIASLSYTLSQTRLKRLWFGPSLGADVFFRPHPAWMLSVGYFYYFLHFDQRFDPFADLSYESPISSEYFIRQKFRVSVPAYGQRVAGKISAQISEEWRLNLLFNAFLFNVHEKKIISKQNFQQVLPAESFFSVVQRLSWNAWWQAYATLLEIEYFF
jgi:hypothetical protein